MDKNVIHQIIEEGKADEQFIREYKQYFTDEEWQLIFRNSNLSEDFIREIFDYIKKNTLMTKGTRSSLIDIVVAFYNEVSDKFLEEFADYMTYSWRYVLHNNKEDIIMKHINDIPWALLVGWCERELYVKYLDYMSYDTVKDVIEELESTPNPDFWPEIKELYKSKLGLK